MVVSELKEQPRRFPPNVGRSASKCRQRIRRMNSRLAGSGRIQRTSSSPRRRGSRGSAGYRRTATDSCSTSPCRHCGDHEAHPFSSPAAPRKQRRLAARDERLELAACRLQTTTSSPARPRAPGMRWGLRWRRTRRMRTPPIRSLRRAASATRSASRSSGVQSGPTIVTTSSAGSLHPVRYCHGIVAPHHRAEIAGRRQMMVQPALDHQEGLAAGSPCGSITRARYNPLPRPPASGPARSR